MSESTVPDFFARFPMHEVHAHDIDAVLERVAAPLAIVFLWGRDCHNCDVAKRAILSAAERFRWPGVCWLQGNVQDDPALGARFGLQGVPAFIVFRGTRRIGRITPWPGTDAFVTAIEQQRAAVVMCPGVRQEEVPEYLSWRASRASCSSFPLLPVTTLH